MNLEEFVKETFKTLGKYDNRPKIVCEDGFDMSVQGSSTHYCSPRTESRMYASMEIGFPSEKEDLLMPFAENKEDPTCTVYGWVDVDIIQSVINKHGGISVSNTFKQNS